ncbi:hypothetical protein Bbelb_020980 [Branchiostoma belcheri]|nr:hypothetical protein Bbelb_020980 [Branchiostoma belcheri]
MTHRHHQAPLIFRECWASIVCIPLLSIFRKALQLPALWHHVNELVRGVCLLTPEFIRYPTEHLISGGTTATAHVRIPDRRYGRWKRESAKDAQQVEIRWRGCRWRAGGEQVESWWKVVREQVERMQVESWWKVGREQVERMQVERMQVESRWRGCRWRAGGEQVERMQVESRWRAGREQVGSRWRSGGEQVESSWR